jgi:hypothetical protein
VFCPCCLRTLQHKHSPRGLEHVSEGLGDLICRGTAEQWQATWSTHMESRTGVPPIHACASPPPPPICRVRPRAQPGSPPQQKRMLRCSPLQRTLRLAHPSPRPRCRPAGLLQSQRVWRGSGCSLLPRCYCARAQRRRDEGALFAGTVLTFRNTDPLICWTILHYVLLMCRCADLRRQGVWLAEATPPYGPRGTVAN